MNFADRLDNAIKEKESVICAGLDPRVNLIPECFLKEAAAASSTNEELAYYTLFNFYKETLPEIATEIVATKPNIAFFEQYGIGGLKAFRDLLALCTELKLLTVTDAKRGDIGSTAEAYANAFLGTTEIGESEFSEFGSDALTVNPFLGFDTLTPYLERCAENGRAIFVLVKTSNPGSKDLQQVTENSKDISTRIAEWIAQNSNALKGSSGLSGLGAVVGATHPGEATELRGIMPDNFFLIPGVGAQGASAEDARAGFRADGRGGLVNASRGIFSSLSDLTVEKPVAIQEVKEKAIFYKNLLAEQA